MLTVGARATCAPFVLTSAARAAPNSRASSRFQVDARLMPTGKLAAGVPLASAPAPRAPFGPSVTLIDGIPRRSTGTVPQKPPPARRLICSSSVKSSTSDANDLGLTVHSVVKQNLLPKSSSAGDVTSTLFVRLTYP